MGYKKIDGGDKKEILDYLTRHKLMSLGTFSSVPWAAWVYYIIDDNFNFYFVSDPATRHCRNIAKNSKVSVTIADSAQKSSDKKKGFQATGVASKVRGISELKEIIKAWNSRGYVPVTYKLLTKVWKSRFYKIRLSEIQIFDESQSEDNEIRCWKL